MRAFTRTLLKQLQTIKFYSFPTHSCVSRVAVKTPINAPITPGVQADENSAAKNFQISEL